MLFGVLAVIRQHRVEPSVSDGTVGGRRTGGGLLDGRVVLGGTQRGRVRPRVDHGRSLGRF